MYNMFKNVVTFKRMEAFRFPCAHKPQPHGKIWCEWCVDEEQRKRRTQPYTSYAPWASSIPSANIRNSHLWLFVGSSLCYTFGAYISVGILWWHRHNNDVKSVQETAKTPHAPTHTHTAEHSFTSCRTQMGWRAVWLIVKFICKCFALCYSLR